MKLVIGSQLRRCCRPTLRRTGLAYAPLRPHRLKTQGAQCSLSALRLVCPSSSCLTTRDQAENKELGSCVTLKTMTTLREHHATNTPQRATSRLTRAPGALTVPSSAGAWPPSRPSMRSVTSFRNICLPLTHALSQRHVAWWTRFAIT